MGSYYLTGHYLGVCSNEIENPMIRQPCRRISQQTTFFFFFFFSLLFQPTREERTTTLSFQIRYVSSSLINYLQI
ncbi:hypothetical protein P8452_04685 [Trifolium repens]|nr:hypothetical protein P8452_04685 [Trifolium repens]